MHIISRIDIPGLPIKIAIIFVFLLAACASKEPWHPEFGHDFGGVRFLTAMTEGKLKQTYNYACSTRHTDPKIIQQCYQDQYASGFLILKDMIDKEIPRIEIEKCMNAYHFPEGTPDLVDIVMKDCYLPKDDVE